MKIKPLDIVGTKINYVTITKYLGKDPKYHRYEGRCDCGSITNIPRHEIIGKGRKRESCGCINKKRIGELGKSINRTHGMSATAIYNRWRTMIDRCHLPSSQKFKLYGGRGIFVCPEWHKFERFFQDMGYPPSSAYSIDRIDVDGPYSKDNCRWATQKTQQNNRRNTRMITFKGETKTLTEWAEITGINARIIRQRLDRDKKTVAEAFGYLAETIIPV